jgi:hypothetical protein
MLAAFEAFKKLPKVKVAHWVKIRPIGSPWLIKETNEAEFGGGSFFIFVFFSIF